MSLETSSFPAGLQASGQWNPPTPWVEETKLRVQRGHPRGQSWHNTRWESRVLCRERGDLQERSWNLQWGLTSTCAWGTRRSEKKPLERTRRVSACSGNDSLSHRLHWKTSLDIGGVFWRVMSQWHRIISPELNASLVPPTSLKSRPQKDQTNFK